MNATSGAQETTSLLRATPQIECEHGHMDGDCFPRHGTGNGGGDRVATPAAGRGTGLGLIVPGSIPTPGTHRYQFLHPHEVHCD